MALPLALVTATLREAQTGQNGRGGKYTLLQSSQRCSSNSLALQPFQKCCVSGVGCGRARPGVAIVRFPLQSDAAKVKASSCGRQIRCAPQQLSPATVASWLQAA